MIIPDVNVLVYSFRGDASEHVRYRAWLERLINGDEAYAIADLVCSGFLRIVTHPRIFSPPTPIGVALAFLDTIRRSPSCSIITPGVRHWQLFASLCEAVNARGNLVPDAYLAALAIESGSEWITADRDFARFPGLRWRHPFD